MTVILTATSIADVSLRSSSLTAVETTSGRLAPYCPEGIKQTYINDSSGVFRPSVVIRFPAMMQGWVSFYQWAGDITTNNWGHYMWSLVNWNLGPDIGSAGVFKNINALTYNSVRPNGTNNTSASMTGVTSSLQRWDIYFNLHASTGQIIFYIDGTQVFSFTGNTLPTASGFTGFDALTFQREGGANPSDRVWSGIIISTSDTRQMHLVVDYPTSDGALQEWSGDYEDVDGTGVDAGSQISSNATTLRSTFEFPALPGALSAKIPVAVGLRVRGPDFVPPIDTLTRIAGNNYTIGDALPQPRNSDPGVSYLAQNPATSAAWTIAAAEAAELGVRRKAS
jgi:hypothetical protein